MNLCVFSGGFCVKCGEAKLNERQVCGGWRPGNPSTERFPQEPAPGLGDMVAAGLSAVGITKDRVSAIAGGDCGCVERQEWLNRLGRMIGIGTIPTPSEKFDG